EQVAIPFAKTPEKSQAKRRPHVSEPRPSPEPQYPPLGLAIQAKEHWKQFRPKMYQELLKSGELDRRAQEAAENTLEARGRLIQQGMKPNEAWEAVRENWVFLPSEE